MKPGGRKIVIRAALALAIAAVAFVALRPLSRPSIRMDGHGYYSTLASILFDHDLDFTNEMAHTDAAMNFYDAVVHPATAFIALSEYKDSKDPELLSQVENELTEVVMHVEQLKDEGRVGKK